MTLLSLRKQVDGDELLLLETDAVFWCVFLSTFISLWSLDGSSKCDHLKMGWKNLVCSKISRDETADHSCVHQQELHGGRASSYSCDLGVCTVLCVKN